MKNTIFFILMNVMLSMMIIGCLQSCNPQKKIAKAEQVLKANNALAKICSENFPIRTEYIKGDSVLTYSFDTLYVGGIIFDTVYTKDTVRIVKTLPAKIITNTKTVRVIDTIREENPATIKVLRDANTGYIIRNGILEGERDSWKAKAKQRLWWFLIAVGAIGAYVLLKVKRIISF